MAISIRQLREAAERLPSNPQGHYHRVAIMPSMSARYWDPYDRPDMAVHVDTITFCHKPVTIEGVKATAWFYNDVLVKVCV